MCRLNVVVADVSVYRTLPGAPLLSAFTVTTRWLAARFPVADPEKPNVRPLKSNVAWVPSALLAALKVCAYRRRSTFRWVENESPLAGEPRLETRTGGAAWPLICIRR